MEFRRRPQSKLKEDIVNYEISIIFSDGTEDYSSIDIISGSRKRTRASSKSEDNSTSENEQISNSSLNSKYRPLSKYDTLYTNVRKFLASQLVKGHEKEGQYDRKGNYILNFIPNGYKLFEKINQDNDSSANSISINERMKNVAVAGHPSGNSFFDLYDFSKHLIYLVSANIHSLSLCTCNLCIAYVKEKPILKKVEPTNKEIVQMIKQDYPIMRFALIEEKNRDIQPAGGWFRVGEIVLLDANQDDRKFPYACLVIKRPLPDEEMWASFIVDNNSTNRVKDARALSDSDNKTNLLQGYTLQLLGSSRIFTQIKEFEITPFLSKIDEIRDQARVGSAPYSRKLLPRDIVIGISISKTWSVYGLIDPVEYQKEREGLWSAYQVHVAVDSLKQPTPNLDNPDRKDYAFAGCWFGTEKIWCGDPVWIEPDQSDDEDSDEEMHENHKTSQKHLSSFNKAGGKNSGMTLTEFIKKQKQKKPVKPQEDDLLKREDKNYNYDELDIFVADEIRASLTLPASARTLSFNGDVFQPLEPSQSSYVNPKPIPPHLAIHGSFKLVNKLHEVVQLQGGALRGRWYPQYKIPGLAEPDRKNQDDWEVKNMTFFTSRRDAIAAFLTPQEQDNMKIFPSPKNNMVLNV